MRIYMQIGLMSVAVHGRNKYENMQTDSWRKQTESLLYMRGCLQPWYYSRTYQQTAQKLVKKLLSYLSVGTLTGLGVLVVPT